MLSIKISVVTSLYRCARFLENYLSHVVKIDNLYKCEFILVHNDPLSAELNMIEAYKDKGIEFVHICVPRENLYSSWNRAVKIAKGQYIAIWNVDDIRFPDSLSLQEKALDENNAAVMAYGNMFGSTKYGVYGELLYQYPEWQQSKEEFYRSYLTSCFQMYRKSVHQSLGYYDEQFRSSGDFDFQIRTALHYPMIKVKGVLGVYLEHQSHKLSSNAVQVLENNIIYLRYGVFEKIQFHMLPKSILKYKLRWFMLEGKWVKNKEKTPFDFFYRAKGILIGICRMPVHMARTLKNNLAPSG
jgi:glycosyltransferase involved in cell wall biosynthesis